MQNSDIDSFKLTSLTKAMTIDNVSLDKKRRLPSTCYSIHNDTHVFSADVPGINETTHEPITISLAIHYAHGESPTLVVLSEGVPPYSAIIPTEDNHRKLIDITSDIKKSVYAHLESAGAVAGLEASLYLSAALSRTVHSQIIPSEFEIKINNIIDGLDMTSFDHFKIAYTISELAKQNGLPYVEPEMMLDFHDDHDPGLQDTPKPEPELIDVKDIASVYEQYALAKDMKRTLNANLGPMIFNIVNSLRALPGIQTAKQISQSIDNFGLAPAIDPERLINTEGSLLPINDMLIQYHKAAFEPAVINDNSLEKVVNELTQNPPRLK